MPQIPTKYLVVETTDLQTRAKSFKVYERSPNGARIPVVMGLPTREAAETKIRELEEGKAQ
jgi:hypothetical protein